MKGYVFRTIFYFTVCFIASRRSEPTLRWDMDIVKNNTIYCNNNLKFNATITKSDTHIVNSKHRKDVLKANGTRSGFFVKSSRLCAVNLTQCSAGFTFAFRVFWSTAWFVSFIIASRHLRMQVFTEVVVPIEVSFGDRHWTVFHQRNMAADRWQFYTIVWNTTCLFVYVDDRLTDGPVCAARPFKVTYDYDHSQLAMAVPIENKANPVYIMLDDVMIWNNVSLTKQQVKDVYNKDEPKTRACATSVHNKNKYFDGFELLHIKVNEVVECAKICLRSTQCRSFNYNRTSKQCVLNSADRHTVIIKHFSVRKGWTYYDKNISF